MTESIKHNFIIVFPGGIYQYVFGASQQFGGAAYVEDLKQSLLNRIARRSLYKIRVPETLRIGLCRSISKRTLSLLRKASEEMADPEKPVCFVLDRSYLSFLNVGLYEVLKDAFPGSKAVVFYTDLVRNDKINRRLLSGQQHKLCTDLICTYDPGDAARYDLYFHDLPCMDYSDRFRNEQIEYDVVFIGRNKGRLDLLLKIRNRLNRLGLRCAVFLTDMTQEEMKDLPADIRCCDWMQYEECLRISAKSRIILELIQDGSEGNTLRVSEAITLGKKLLSNNRMLREDPLYDPVNMFVFEEPDDIPDAFLLEEAGAYPEEIKRKLSLLQFLNDLEQQI